MSHKDHKILEKEIAKARKLIQVGCTYVHFRYPDKRYQVLDIGIQEEGENLCVIYCDTGSPSVHFVRNLDSWLETLIIDGKSVPHFTKA